MRTLSLTLLVTMLTGCGAYRETEFDNRKKFDPNGFDDYVEMFKEDAALVMGQELVVDNLIIEFDTIENAKQKDGTVIAGICYYNLTPLIVVNRDIWVKLSDAKKQALMYHEMGHCVLMRDHVPAVDKFSIMNPILHNDQVLQDNYDYLMEELFTKTYYGSHYDFTLHEGDDCDGTTLDAGHPSDISSDPDL